jgi:hypothetical protein
LRHRLPSVDEIAGRYENRPLVRAAGLCFPVSEVCALVQLLTSRPRSLCWRLARQQQFVIDGHIHAQAPQAARRAQAVWQAVMAETKERITREAIRSKR